MTSNDNCQNAASIKSRYAALHHDLQLARKKLDSKNDAILILSQELGQCQIERDQYKLMADQLKGRCHFLKRQLNDNDTEEDDDSSRLNSDSLLANQLLIEDLKQKLADAEGDVKILRQKIAQQRLTVTKNLVDSNHSTPHDKEVMIAELEDCQRKYCQLELDMKQLLAEKEELVTERDSFKLKYSRLNQELNSVMRGESDDTHILDIDSLNMENKFLKRQVQNLKEEAAISKSTLQKYKTMSTKKKPVTSVFKSQGTAMINGLLLTQQQIKRLLNFTPSINDASSLQVISDLKNLTTALLDTLNDKNIALSHQRKTNKLLASRILELEEKLESHDKLDLVQLEGLRELCLSPINSSETLSEGLNESSLLDDSPTHTSDLNMNPLLHTTNAIPRTNTDLSLHHTGIKPLRTSNAILRTNADLSLQHTDIKPLHASNGTSD